MTSRHFDNAASKFWVENQERQAKLSVKWNEQFGAEQRARATVRNDEFQAGSDGRREDRLLNGVPQGVAECGGGGRTMPEMRFPLQRESERMKIHRLQLSFEKRYGDAPVDTSPMKRPVTPETRQLIYEGVSREDEGKKKYLKRRVVVQPEDKYKYPVTGGQDYGWEVGQVMRQYAPSAYGRQRVIHESFYRKNKVLNPSQGADGLSSVM